MSTTKRALVVRIPTLIFEAAIYPPAAMIPTLTSKVELTNGEEEEELIKAQRIVKTKKLYEAAAKSAKVSGAKAVVSAHSAAVYFVTRDQARQRAKEIETQALAQAHINVSEAEAAILVAEERKSNETTTRAVVEAVKIALMVKNEARSIAERVKKHADPRFWEPYKGELELKKKGAVFGANWVAVSARFRTKSNYAYLSTNKRVKRRTSRRKNSNRSLRQASTAFD
jgi:predicted secreted acid phosphatase